MACANLSSCALAVIAASIFRQRSAAAAQQRKAVAREVEVIERHETFQIAAAFDEPLRGSRIVLPGNCRQAETERIPGQGRLFERGAQTIQEIPRQYRCRAQGQSEARRCGGIERAAAFDSRDQSQCALQVLFQRRGGFIGNFVAARVAAVAQPRIGSRAQRGTSPDSAAGGVDAPPANSNGASTGRSVPRTRKVAVSTVAGAMPSGSARAPNRRIVVSTRSRSASG